MLELVVEILQPVLEMVIPAIPNRYLRLARDAVDEVVDSGAPNWMLASLVAPESRLFSTTYFSALLPLAAALKLQ